LPTPSFLRNDNRHACARLDPYSWELDAGNLFVWVCGGAAIGHLFNVMAANDNCFEGLTIRNTDVAFLAGLKNIAGSRGLTVKNCRFLTMDRDREALCLKEKIPGG